MMFIELNDILTEENLTSAEKRRLFFEWRFGSGPYNSALKSQTQQYEKLSI